MDRAQPDPTLAHQMLEINSYAQKHIAGRVRAIRLTKSGVLQRSNRAYCQRVCVLDSERRSGLEAGHHNSHRIDVSIVLAIARRQAAPSLELRGARRARSSFGARFGYSDLKQAAGICGGCGQGYGN
jgi:hypothetical protein